MVIQDFVMSLLNFPDFSPEILKGGIAFTLCESQRTTDHTVVFLVF